MYLYALAGEFKAANAAKIQVIDNVYNGILISLHMPQTGVSMEPKLDLERPQTSEKSLAMGRESVDSFLSSLESQGKTKLTIETYRRCLERLLVFLPDDKAIGADTLSQWRDAILAEGAAVGTANLHVAAANSYLEFAGHRELQAKLMPPEHSPETPALTWTEYLRLLETARTLEDRRPYLFVKLFCNTGIRIRELPNVTVEAVENGEMTTGSKKSLKRLLFPSSLRAELLDYASGAGIRSGSLFVRRNGNPLDHSEILPMIVKLFKKAGVPRNKATSKTLRQFYRATRERIHAEIAAQLEGTL